MNSRQDMEESGGELYGKIAPWVVIVVVLLGGWLAREPLKVRFALPAPKGQLNGLPALGLSSPAATAPGAEPVAPPVPRKDTVYRWVDSNGVTHYDQRAGSDREAVEVDQGRINSLNHYDGPVK